MEAQQKQQLADRLNQANNILVTVSTNPSVDQLAACIGLTLAMNKLGKHAAAVFSGQVPSTIEFLQPEKTLEKNTDSLRDFIIALDKSKADKLRYKVEDKVVKIFITPYKTSISEKDFEFSQGDFNVDIVVALGVHNQTDIDQAITAHGRILHDAVVATINTKAGGELGAINWVSPASSLSELVVMLLNAMGKKVLDTQMATALLTGIVAETQRFSNPKTSPQTMTVSAELMSAGANQQLVATKLEPPKPVAPPPPPLAPVAAKPVAPAPPAPKVEATTKQTEGMLEIDHGDKPNLGEGEEDPQAPQIHIDKEGTLRSIEEIPAQSPNPPTPPPPITPAEPPAMPPLPPAPTPDPPEPPITPISTPSIPPAHTESPRHILQPSATPTIQPITTSPLPTTPPAGAGEASDPLSLPQPGPDDEERPSGAPPLPPINQFNNGPTHNYIAPPPPQSPVTSLQDSQESPDQPITPVQPTITPPTANTNASADGRTLSQIEQDVGSPHAASYGGSMPPTTIAPTTFTPSSPTPNTPATPPALDGDSHLASARDAVNQAIVSQSGSTPPEPIAALNALPVDLPLRDQPGANAGQSAQTTGGGGVVIGPAPGYVNQPTDPNAPPPGPPPMMPPTQ